MLRALWTVLRGRRTPSSELSLEIRRNKPPGKCLPSYVYHVIADLTVRCGSNAQNEAGAARQEFNKNF
jgi:hypothetical protein